MSNPQFFYSDQVSKIMTQNHPRGGGFPTVEDFDKINFERAYEIYQDRFADASDFKFIFVGNFNIEEITPMLEQYIGSLPKLDRNETWNDLGFRPPQGVVEEIVKKGTDPKSLVTINFTGVKRYDRRENHILRSLGEVLTIKLVEMLREEKGEVYGVGASGGSIKYPEESYEFRIGFPCAPENVDDLVAAAFAEIDKIKKDGVTDEDLKKVKETQRRNREESLKQNNYWLSQLRSFYFAELSLDSFYQSEELTTRLSSNDLQEAANKYINMDNYVKVVLMPEN